MSYGDKDHDVEETLFIEMYGKAAENQDRLLSAASYVDVNRAYKRWVPCDDVKIMQYHVNHLICELGEFLKEDNRWKIPKEKASVNERAKLEEYADCFIEIMNIGIFSGYYVDEIVDAVMSKLEKVGERNVAQG